MKQWTDDEAINYECAREAITSVRAILTAQIHEEAKKPNPDAAYLEGLYVERSKMFDERAALHVKDQANIARVRAEYGARFRALRQERQAMGA